MEFWASSECEKNAYESLARARKCIEPHINSEIAKSSLAELNCKIRYVPIVMPESHRSWYPERSKLRKRQRIYDSAPQLDYELFVQGTLEDQLREYLRGIAEAVPYLAEFDATPEQIEEFSSILSNTVEAILSVRPDQTRH